MRPSPSRRRIVAALAVAGLVLPAVWSGGPDRQLAWADQAGAGDPAPQSANPWAFSLIDHGGRSVTDKDFLGRFMLVFFGYTHCPDICPTDLMIVSQALDILGEGAEKVRPVFITIDPARDTPQVMAEFVANFHPSLVGLTGAPEQIAAIAKPYRARYKKYYPAAEGGESGEGGQGGDCAAGDEAGCDYLMDHTAATYLIGPDGKLLGLFPHGTTAEDIAASILPLLGG